MSTMLLSLLILVMLVAREFIYKPIADKYPPAVAMIADGLSGIIMAAVVVFMASEPVILHPALLSSLISGALLSYQVKFFQIVRKESLSANSYILIIALGVGALLSYVYGERLRPLQYAVVVSVALVGYGFFRFFVRNLSPETQKAWLLALGLTTIVISAPTFELAYTNWVSVFLFRNIGNLLTDIYEFNKCRGDLDQRRLCFDPQLLLLGAFGILFELLCMYANPIIGVTTVLVAKRGAIPVIMLLSFVIYHEGKPKEQVVFAGLAGVLAILYYMAM